MAKEFEFFIKDDAPGVWKMAQEKKQQGVIVVENATGLLSELRERTGKGDHVIVRYSGGVVEDCLVRTARDLLGTMPQKSGFEVDRVVVDVSTSVSFAERIIPVSVSERRSMFINLLGSRFSEDSRLTVLPEHE